VITARNWLDLQPCSVYSLPVCLAHIAVLKTEAKNVSENRANLYHIKQNKQTPWSDSASELYRQNDRLSAKLLPTSADRGCHVVSVTDLYGCFLGSLDRKRYFFFQVAPQLYSQG
jgi:hypothetical protein